MTGTIEGFRGSHRFLSNFWPAPLTYRGKLYPTSEHAYQAAKFVDPAYAELIRQTERPGEVKRLGRTTEHEVHPFWRESGRAQQVMADVSAAKYRHNPELARLLVETGDAMLIESNDWHDGFFGDCTCGRQACVQPGRNHLGIILMAVRASLRPND